jgi:hypothetical protein
LNSVLIGLVQSPELIWDGAIDAGSRAEALVAGLELRHPAGVLIAVNPSHALVEIPTRSYWAFATWAVSALMIWFGLTSDNWFLLVLAPFMMGAAIMQSFGRICVLIKDEQISVFEGVGGVGRRVQVSLRAIQRVEYAVKHGRGRSRTTWIVLHADGRDVKVGRHLNEEQIQFVIALLLDAIQSLAA